MELITKLEETIGPVGIIFVVLLVSILITAIVVAIILGVSELKRYSDYKKYERERSYYGDDSDEGHGAHFW